MTVNRILPGTDIDKWSSYINKQEGKKGYQNGGKDGFDILNHLFTKPRAGYKMRGVPIFLCETVGEHCLRHERACMSVIEGTPERVESSGRFAGMARFHDITEYPPEVPDITPYCDYTKDDKILIEAGVMDRIKLILGERGRGIMSLIREYQEQKTPDSKEASLHDKILAGVGAFEYEKIGFGKEMANFHPRILGILEKDSYLKNIYEILLEREFGSIDYFIQYYMLLQLAGDYEQYKEKMTGFTKNIKI